MRLRIHPDTESEIVEAIESSAGIEGTYLTLLILSSVIASFGLISNSTATVIGAMIVAPLMGPILGISLGLVKGNIVRFRRALIAEFLGVLLCLATSFCIVWLVGAGQVDFSQSEIIGRTRPNLLDLAIGFFAGLAGAYCSINRRVSSSIAGVAIAVALVPPLCVSGMCFGAGLYQQGLGAFILFAANFMTIQLAATLVFAACGLGHWNNVLKERSLVQALGLNVFLLALTGWFLTLQLEHLVAERNAEKTCREVVAGELSRVSGATLDSLRAHLNENELKVDVLARAPEEITVSFAQSLENALRKRLFYNIDLRISTALASYVTPFGRLFVHDLPALNPSALLLQDTQLALQKSLKELPEVEMTSFRQLQVESKSQNVFVAVRCPYTINGAMISRLQIGAIALLKKQHPEQERLNLTVRTTLTQDYTVDGLQESPTEYVLTAAESRRLDVEKQAQELLREQVEIFPETHVVGLHAETQATLPGQPDIIHLSARVQSLKPIGRKTLEAWRTVVATKLQSPVELNVFNELGREMKIPAPPLVYPVLGPLLSL